jgi:hypothetical protein
VSLIVIEGIVGFGKELRISWDSLDIGVWISAE